MTDSLSPGFQDFVQHQMVILGYKSEEQLFRDAIAALAEKQADLVAIAEGIEDMEAGRVRPFAEVVDEIAARHGWKAR